MNDSCEQNIVDRAPEKVVEWTIEEVVMRLTTATPWLRRFPRPRSGRLLTHFRCYSVGIADAVLGRQSRGSKWAAVCYQAIR